MKPTRKVLRAASLFAGCGILGSLYYVRSNPLVFNESLFQHAHCMSQVGIALRIYAADHHGKFPNHANGYGDALLAMAEQGPYNALSGPGFKSDVFANAWESKSDVDEGLCGRVYVQGLAETNDPQIAILFDKVAAPPDHCHFPRRLWAGWVREVCFVDGSWRGVPVDEWNPFAHAQIDLLVKAGFSRQNAEKIYGEVR